MTSFPSVLNSRPGTELVTGVPGIDPRVSWLDPIIGEWWIDPSRCYYDRPSPVPPDPEGWTPLRRNGVRPTSGAGGIGVGKWTYVPEGEGVRTFYFFGNGPDSTPAPMMQYFATWDGMPWADPHSTLLPGQLAQVWRLDPRCIVRLVLDNTSPIYKRWEWAVWAPSTDGRTFACTSWDSADPDRHNLQVFTKHLGPIYDSRGTDAPTCGVTSEGSVLVEEGDPMLATWTFDVNKSSFLRRGQDAMEPQGRSVHSDLSFERDGDGFRERHIGSSGDTFPSRSLFFCCDGVDYPAAQQSESEQTVTSWKLGPELMIRRLRLHGASSEWAIYAWSGDGGTMAITSWDEATPSDRDIQVFRRVEEQ